MASRGSPASGGRPGAIFFFSKVYGDLSQVMIFKCSKFQLNELYSVDYSGVTQRQTLHFIYQIYCLFVFKNTSMIENQFEQTVFFKDVDLPLNKIKNKLVRFNHYKETLNMHKTR
jgi:hypothetical protein